MKFSFATLSLSICILAAISGLIFFNLFAPDFSIKNATSTEPVHTNESGSSVKPKTSHLPTRKTDWFAVALGYLKKIDAAVKAKMWREALRQEQNLSQVMSTDRISAHQRDYIKNRLLDIAKPVFETGDPRVAMAICVRGCLQPSHSPEPLKLSSKMIDIAEILFNRLSSENPSAGHNFRYYLNTAKVFMRESKIDSVEKSRIEKRIKDLENRIKARATQRLKAHLSEV